MDITKSKFLLNVTSIKIIAVVLMVFDHIHQMFAPMGVPVWLTWLGRPVFPLFLFAMAESFHYTRSRKKLLIRILLASWIMTVVNMALGTVLPNNDVVLVNNAFSTFFVTTLYMLFFDMLVDGIKTRKPWEIIGAILLCAVPVLAAIPVIWATSLANPLPLWIFRALFYIPNILLLEGGPAMVVLGVLFYVFRCWRWAQVTALAALSVIVFYLNPSFQWMMVFAVIPMLLYNGEKGIGMKNFFYIFYPTHIYLLYIIATLLNA